MTPGYLAVHTHDAHGGWVRLVTSPHQPDAAQGAPNQPQIRYIARFNDIEAALMHTHEILKRRLLDPDAHLYRASLAQAIAAVESLALRHRGVYIDPDLDATTRAEIDAQRQRNIDAQQRKDRFFQVLGSIGIGILLFNLLVLSFA
ncbi:MAG: hypothetical protein QNJ91_08330 [Gammaproteobacteria bacterium]|nr:hypothetical protein [Gammaproteobacteria bacterium]